MKVTSIDKTKFRYKANPQISKSQISVGKGVFDLWAVTKILLF